MNENVDVIIVGGGLSGLSTAFHCHKMGMSYVLLEKDSEVGGKLKTEVVDGFTLDCGFQTTFSNYPELQGIVNLSKLDMRYFDFGARVMKEGTFFTMANPIKHPSQITKVFSSKIATFVDYIRLWRLQRSLKGQSEDEIFDKYEAKTSTVLRKRFFSSKITNHFFFPLFSGIFLEDELVSSRRSFEFFFQLMTNGKTGVPAKGMQEIALQIKSKIDQSCIRLNTEVVKIEDNRVITKDGKTYEGKQIAVVTAFPEMKNMVDTSYKVNYRSTTCVYFSSDTLPLSHKLIILNANKEKLVNNLAVMSNVAPERAPAGKHLIQCSINGYPTATDSELEAAIKDELRPYFAEIEDWKMLKCYRIKAALPDQTSVLSHITPALTKVSKHIWTAGDYFMYGSINAALKAGREISKLMADELNINQKKRKAKSKYSNLFKEKD